MDVIRITQIRREVDEGMTIESLHDNTSLVAGSPALVELTESRGKESLLHLHDHKSNLSELRNRRSETLRKRGSYILSLNSLEKEQKKIKKLSNVCLSQTYISLI